MDEEKEVPASSPPVERDQDGKARADAALLAMLLHEKAEVQSQRDRASGPRVGPFHV